MSPGTHMAAHYHLQLHFQGSDSSSNFHGLLNTCGTHTLHIHKHTHTHTHTHTYTFLNSQQVEMVVMSFTFVVVFLSFSGLVMLG